MTPVVGGIRKCAAVALDFADRVIGYDVEMLLPEDALVQSDVLIRWGDGESSLAIGKSTSFQRASPELAKELRRLLRVRQSNITMCFPGFLLDKSPFAHSDDRFRRVWLLSALMMRLWVRGGSYGDAFMFRRESGMSGLDALSKLLSEAQHIVLVSPDPRHPDPLRSSKPGARVQHLVVPARNAYSHRNEIKRAILACGKPDVLLLSAGPTGKCLAPEIMSEWQHGTKIVDTGNLFDHLLHRGEAK